jgi:signal transduction histidine kinase
MPNTIPQLKSRIKRFVGGILLAVVLTSAWSIYIQYCNAVTFAERQATDYARALAEHSENAFAEADRIMQDTIHDLKHDLNLDGGIERIDRRTLFELLRRETEGAPQVGTMFIAAKDGTILANSTAFPQKPINVADRDYFRHYQTTLGADFTIGKTDMSRLVARWRFNLMRPLPSRDNNFNGLIAVAFEADYFNKFMGPGSLGANCKVLLLNDNGTPLVYEPYETNAYTTDFHTTTLFSTKLPASPSGTYHGIYSNADSKQRIISYQHLQRFPIVAVVVLHKGDVLGPWGWKALYQSLITIGLCLVIGVLTMLMFRQMDSLQSTRTVVNELEGELQHLQKVEALGQLAGGISHDFNNLLTPILIYAEMVRRGLPEGHRQLRRIDGIITAAHNARDLNLKLMTFGRKQTLRMEVLDLNEVIESFRDVIRGTIPESIDIDVKLAKEGAWIQADRNQLEQVFLNLAANASDAIAGAGTISVAIRHIIIDTANMNQHHGMATGTYTLVEFKDSGRGMDDETLSHIYEPFYTTKAAGHGTGLGLATAYAIIKQHGGYIEIRSHVGEGTAILIYLPVTTEKTVKPANSVPSAKSKPNAAAVITILLVEDDVMVREMAADLLESEGFTVLIADSPAKAQEIEQSFNGTIDLLLTDVVMPRMNGVELYKSLRSKRPAMPVLYISGYTSDADVSNGTLGEAANFVRKPFTVELFLEKVKQVIGSP